MSHQTYYRPGSIASTVDCVENMSPDVREQRAKHLQVRERQQRLAAAQAEVEAARKALERVRDVSAETAALEAARKKLAEIEGELAVQ
ncbi:hypothetical protein ACQPTN_21390 [Bradyrhizobium sp. 13971]